MTSSCWRFTLCGRGLDLLNPDPADIELDDIATGLSWAVRWNGQTRYGVTVAEHSVLVSHEVASECALWGLMHDAAEAYVGDVAAPLKERLGELRAIEVGVLRAVAERFSLPWPVPDAVREADMVVRGWEAGVYVRRPVDGRPEVLRGAYRDLVRLGSRMMGRGIALRTKPWTQRQAAGMFLERFIELTSERKARKEHRRRL